MNQTFRVHICSHLHTGKCHFYDVGGVSSATLLGAVSPDTLQTDTDAIR